MAVLLTGVEDLNLVIIFGMIINNETLKLRRSRSRLDQYTFHLLRHSGTLLCICVVVQAIAPTKEFAERP